MLSTKSKLNNILYYAGFIYNKIDSDTFEFTLKSTGQKFIAHFWEDNEDECLSIEYDFDFPPKEKVRLDRIQQSVNKEFNCPNVIVSYEDLRNPISDSSIEDDTNYELEEAS